LNSQYNTLAKKVIAYAVRLHSKWSRKTLNNPTNNDRKIKKVIVLRRNGLGDAVFTALGIKKLQDTYPNIKFAVLSTQYTQPIYDLIVPEACQYFLKTEKYIGHYLGLAFHPTMKQIRKEKFDLAISCSASYSSRSIYMLKCTGAKTISATINTKIKAFWNVLIDKKITIENGKTKHQMLKVIEIFNQNNLELSLPEKLCASKSSNKKILLCPQSSALTNQWSIQNWEYVYNTLQDKEYSVEVCLPPKSHFIKNFSSHLIIPKNTRDLIQSISQYDLIITQEGGTGHIAAALKKTIIVISNHDLEKTWAPWSKDLFFIHGNGCIKKINPDMILDKIENYIKND
jgi:ADP-heptose:LPS heptosyltransferase